MSPQEKLIENLMGMEIGKTKFLSLMMDDFLRSARKIILERFGILPLGKISQH
jgi:hypothetical protein